MTEGRAVRAWSSLWAVLGACLGTVLWVASWGMLPRLVLSVWRDLGRLVARSDLGAALAANLPYVFGIFVGVMIVACVAGLAGVWSAYEP